MPSSVCHKYTYNQHAKGPLRCGSPARDWPSKMMSFEEAKQISLKKIILKARERKLPD